jgi:hypothetical protein
MCPHTEAPAVGFVGEALVHVTLNNVDWYAAPEVVTVRAGQISFYLFFYLKKQRPTQRAR